MKKDIVSIVILFLTVNVTFLIANDTQNKGYNIAIENQIYNNGYKTQCSNMEMVLINAHGDKVKREMLFQSKEVEGDGDKRLITFNYPADVKGTKTLTWSHKVGSDDTWLLLPALNRVKRINSRNKSSSFMGSEFTYEDISSDEVEKYTFKFINDSELDARSIWIIERYPVDKNSGYSKQVTYVDKEYRQPLKIEYYDRKGDVLKTSLFSDFKQFGKWWYFHKIVMTNHQTQKSSELLWKDRELGKTFKSNLFTKQHLLR